MDNLTETIRELLARDSTVTVAGVAARLNAPLEAVRAAFASVHISDGAEALFVTEETDGACTRICARRGPVPPAAQYYALSEPQRALLRTDSVNSILCSKVTLPSSIAPVGLTERAYPLTTREKLCEKLTDALSPQSSAARLSQSAQFSQPTKSPSDSKRENPAVVPVSPAAPISLPPPQPDSIASPAATLISRQLPQAGSPSTDSAVTASVAASPTVVVSASTPATVSASTTTPQSVVSPGAASQEDNNTAPPPQPSPVSVTPLTSTAAPKVTPSPHMTQPTLFSMFGKPQPKATKPPAPEPAANRKVAEKSKRAPEGPKTTKPSKPLMKGNLGEVAKRSGRAVTVGQGVVDDDDSNSGSSSDSDSDEDAKREMQRFMDIHRQRNEDHMGQESHSNSVMEITIDKASAQGLKKTATPVAVPSSKKSVAEPCAAPGQGLITQFTSPAAIEIQRRFNRVKRSRTVMEGAEYVARVEFVYEDSTTGQTISEAEFTKRLEDARSASGPTPPVTSAAPAVALAPVSENVPATAKPPLAPAAKKSVKAPPQNTVSIASFFAKKPQS